MACDPKTPFYDGEKCVSSCETTYDNNYICETCQEANPLKPMWRSTFGICDSCSLHLDEGDFWNWGGCVKKCSETNFNGACVPCASLSPRTPLWDGRTCTGCAEDGKWVYWDGERCVSECPESAPIATEDHVCRRCEAEFDGGNYWDGTRCVARCPETWDANRVCVTCAEAAESSENPELKEKKIWNAHELKCVEHCGLYQDAGNRCACKEDMKYENGECELPEGADWWDDTY